MANTQPTLRRARTLIKRGNYGLARVLLQQIDNPTAREWLAGLEEAQPQKKRSSDWWLALAVVAAAVGITVLVLVAPRIALQEQVVTQGQLSPADIDQSEPFYLDLMYYCTTAVESDAGACMDWADSVTLEHREAAELCLREFDLDLRDELVGFGDCLGDQGVPPAS